LSNIEEYASLVSRNDDLSRIVEIVGRMETELGMKRMERTKHGRSEVHSVRFSDDIQRMLPHEALNLADPDLEMMFYSKFSERKLMAYDIRGREMVSGPPENKRKGPVVMLVDTSGSMYGEPELMAKAVSLTIARRMIPEKRDVKVILFSTRTTEISLTSKEKMGAEFLEFLSYTFGGGTDFNLALREGVRALREKEWRGADLLFISDGHSIVSDPVITAEWDMLKEMNDARVFSIIINNDDAGGLEELSDSVYMMNNADLGGDYLGIFRDITSSTR
ncbi:MAG: VWA domain-containing protein, partial [Methanomassiliicoccaceae archaeon]|nr:VWA domain-containing protein [Methanomassiliicoccaceae archaeon]